MVGGGGEAECWLQSWPVVSLVRALLHTAVSWVLIAGSFPCPLRPSGGQSFLLTCYSLSVLVPGWHSELPTGSQMLYLWVHVAIFVNHAFIKFRIRLANDSKLT